MSSADQASTGTFSTTDLGLEQRLLKAVARIGYIYPTQVQREGIPLALQGKDLLVRARTGSGKTASYALAILQRLLQRKAQSPDSAVRALILVPTRELVEQTSGFFRQFMYYCKDVLSVCSLSGALGVASEAAALADQPDIVVATPGRLVKHLRGPGPPSTKRQRKRAASTTVSLLDLSRVEMLVVDEADLVLSFGYDDDVKTIVEALPQVCQSFLMSATLSPEVEDLKRLMLQSPVVLKLENAPTDGHLSQFFIRVSPSDRFLLLFSLIKLRLISGKAIFFVNDLDSCYRLKLFLEAFSIPAAVLNAELPANSRSHILQQFNRGFFDFLIATDESMGVDDAETADESAAGEEMERILARAARRAEGRVTLEDDAAEESDDEDKGNAQTLGDSHDDDDDEGEEEEGGEGDEDSDDDDEDSDEEDEEEEEGVSSAPRTATGRKRTRADMESATAAAATTSTATSPEAASAASRAKRRQDRLARLRADLEFGVSRGIDFRNVSTVVNVDFPRSLSAYIHRIGRTARGGASGVALSLVDPHDEEHARLLQLAQARQPPAEGDGSEQPSELPFNRSEVDGFRYRVEDVMRGLTKTAVREARLAELRQEMVNSERLQAHFEDNPRDLAVLNHHQPLLPQKVRPHLATVPDYLLTNTITAAAEAAGGGVAGEGAHSKNRRARQQEAARQDRGARGAVVRGADPLMTFAHNAKRLQLDVSGPTQYLYSTGPKGASGGRTPNLTANRNKWKMRHKKGAWSNKRRKSKRPF